MQKQVEASNLILLNFLASSFARLDLTLTWAQMCGCAGVHIIPLSSRHCPVTRNGAVLMRASGKGSFYQSNSRAVVNASHLLLYSPRLDWQETYRSAGFMPFATVTHTMQLSKLRCVHPGTISDVTTWCRCSTADDVLVPVRTPTKEASWCWPARAVMCWVHVEPKGRGSSDHLSQSRCTGLTWTCTHHGKNKASVTTDTENSGFHA